MATPEAQEAAAKERIIKHMNADHHDSVRRYVEAYSSKSVFQSRDAQMTDITLNDMRINCGGHQAVITFDPPMKSLREARERLVQMDKESLQTLGRSDISITTFIPPYAKLGHMWNFTQCIFAFVLLPRPANFRPGSLVYDNLFFMVPTFASFLAQVCLIIWWIMLPLHTLEAGIMARKLTRHGVTPFEGLWWKWIGSTFVEGVTAFWRLNALINKKRQEKDAKKH